MPRPGKKSAVQNYVKERCWNRIGRAEWNALRQDLPGISDTTLRAAIGELGLFLEQPFAGVQTKTLEELESSLVAMAEAYAHYGTECRAAVIFAKDQARFASRNQNAAEAKRALKAEMVEWMLVWLGDPALFPTWAKLRTEALRKAAAATNPIP